MRMHSVVDNQSQPTVLPWLHITRRLPITPRQRAAVPQPPTTAVATPAATTVVATTALATAVAIMAVATTAVATTAVATTAVGRSALALADGAVFVERADGSVAATSDDPVLLTCQRS
jgi:hypothetical protein